MRKYLAHPSKQIEGEDLMALVLAGESASRLANRTHKTWNEMKSDFAILDANDCEYSKKPPMQVTLYMTDKFVVDFVSRGKWHEVAQHCLLSPDFACDPRDNGDSWNYNSPKFGAALLDVFVTKHCSSLCFEHLSWCLVRSCSCCWACFRFKHKVWACTWCSLLQNSAVFTLHSPVARKQMYVGQHCCA